MLEVGWIACETFYSHCARKINNRSACAGSTLINQGALLCSKMCINTTVVRRRLVLFQNTLNESFESGNVCEDAHLLKSRDFCLTWCDSISEQVWLGISRVTAIIQPGRVQLCQVAQRSAHDSMLKSLKESLKSSSRCRGVVVGVGDSCNLNITLCARTNLRCPSLLFLAFLKNPCLLTRKYCMNGISRCTNLPR